MSKPNIIPLFPSTKALRTGNQGTAIAESTRRTGLPSKQVATLNSAKPEMRQATPARNSQSPANTNILVPSPAHTRNGKPIPIKPTKNTVVFNFKDHWDQVQPFLRHPNFELALSIGINAYCHRRAAECYALNMHPKNWLTPFDPKREEPIDRLSTDYWFLKSERLAEEAMARGEFSWNCRPEEEPSDAEWERFDEFAAQFYPKPGSYQRYQLWGACHWLALAFKELGQLVFPALRWKLLAGEHHSLAYGENDRGEMMMIFDILNFETMSAEELVKFATAKSRPRKHRHTVTSSGTG